MNVLNGYDGVAERLTGKLPANRRRQLDGTMKGDEHPSWGWSPVGQPVLDVGRGDIGELDRQSREGTQSLHFCFQSVEQFLDSLPCCARISHQRTRKGTEDNIDSIGMGTLLFYQSVT